MLAISVSEVEHGNSSLGSYTGLIPTSRIPNSRIPNSATNMKKGGSNSNSLYETKSLPIRRNLISRTHDLSAVGEYDEKMPSNGPIVADHFSVFNKKPGDISPARFR